MVRLLRHPSNWPGVWPVNFTKARRKVEMEAKRLDGAEIPTVVKHHKPEGYGGDVIDDVGNDAGEERREEPCELADDGEFEDGGSLHDTESGGEVMKSTAKMA